MCIVSSFLRYAALLILIIQNGDATQKFEGDQCTDANGVPGLCVSPTHCPGSLPSLSTYTQRPILCGFIGNQPIVCCTPTQNRIDDKGTLNVGDIADKYCKVYSAYTFTWVPSNFPAEPAALLDTCRQRPEALSEPYPRPRSREFPHMVALGIGDKLDPIWICSGTLLSEEYVLTSAQCTSKTGVGLVWARVGDFNLYDDDDDSIPEVVGISQIILHPEHHPGTLRADIALLKLENKVTLNRYVIPACLPGANMSAPIDKAIVTGWHMRKTQGDMSKVTVNIVPETNCRNVTSKNARFDRSLETSTTICSRPILPDDYCQRRSGDPLQVYRSGIHCMYNIIGVTSYFGAPCDAPTIYTNLTSHISWIENTVWPNERRLVQRLTTHDRFTFN